MAMIDTLKRSDLFGSLENAHLQKIADICRGVSFREGAIVFKEGDQATELYVLTDGRLVLEMDVRPVPERPAIPTAVDLISKDESFGGSALVPPYVYTSSARCMSNCTALAIRADVLQKTMESTPSLGYEVMKKLAELISLRLAHTRLRLTTGLGLVLLGRELKLTE